MSKRIVNRIRIYKELFDEGAGVSDKLKIIARFFLYKRGDIKIRTDYGTFQHPLKNPFLVYSGHEKGLREAFKIPGTFVDVGANVGKYSIWMSQFVEKVVAIEPDKQNIAYLKKNISLNGADNIEIIEKACYSEETELDFYIDPKDVSTHSLLTRKKNARKTRVKTGTLDSLNLKNVLLVKIDVEGAELEVIKGAKKLLQEQRPKIILEILTQENRKNIQKLLSKYNYALKNILGDNYQAIPKS
jgi:FkbM family methyltransferase